MSANPLRSDPRPTAPADRRVARTRTALRNAFNSLFFERGYDGFGVADIAAKADVGRSTFYEHYADKRALLNETVAPLLAPLAEAGVADAVDPKLAWVVEHFWENRRRAQAMLGSGAWTAMTRLLATMIETRLTRRARPRRNHPGLPAPLAASLLARAQMGLIEAWLAGHKRCSAEVLAKALHATTRAAEAALLSGG
ncbi:MAG TPA: helix-turn-helix domain-containing protein [Caulobacteraceae bacterium]|jgi:AcrR family transcriptional regulator